MMDGRIGAVRDALDAEGFTDTSIIGKILSCYGLSKRMKHVFNISI